MHPKRLRFVRVCWLAATAHAWWLALFAGWRAARAHVALLVQCSPEQLELGDIIGRGSSSYVQRAVHKPTGTPLALKVLNMYDKGKRDQLIKEVQALYNANCDW